MPQPIDMKRYAQLKAAGDLPSPRGVALAIIRLTQSPDVSLAELGRVIKGDPAFVGRLIKAANGVVGENGRSVVSVQDALLPLPVVALEASVRLAPPATGSTWATVVHLRSFDPANAFQIANGRLCRSTRIKRFCGAQVTSCLAKSW